MLKKYFSFLFVLFLSVIAIVGCKDECKNKTATTANFNLYTIVGDSPRLIPIDTGDTYISLGGTVVFEAQDSSEDVLAYEWKIGNDPRTFTKRTFSLYFDNPSNGVENLSVRLIVHKRQQAACFPNDSGIDTVTKKLSLLSIVSALVIGEFKGYRTSNPLDTFTISTRDMPHIGTGYYYLSNLPKGCLRNNRDVSSLKYFWDYRFITFGRPSVITTGADAACQVPWGEGEVQRDNKTLILNFRIWDTNLNQFVNDQFIGKKIR